MTWYRESYTALPMTDVRMRASGDYPGGCGSSICVWMGQGGWGDGMRSCLELKQSARGERERRQAGGALWPRAGNR